MNSEKWQKIKSVFNQAVELAPDEWEFLFSSQNGVDAEILAEVSKLLAAEKHGNFEQPVANLSNIWREDEPEYFIGREIGNYKITGEIGRGGMGVVFEAVRETEDFPQTVALKLLKRGMDSAAMLRRFRHERRILASLEHPNIARLLDGGMTADGLPFFAMEFIKGKPLDEFCAEKNLSTNERLKLFLQICAAVSFAHSRLVVHRDLKPTNILVTENGTIKLLDFGIAKILSPDGDLQNQTVTALGMMTPQYASPEQIRGEIVSTASDIYSLGLILFELLTGTPAYNFPNNRPDEIAKIICESEPPRPSAVSSQQSAVGGHNSTSENKAKRTNSKFKTQNSKFLKGDLDNIILKALRKEPPRRYVSVEQFANDISRHLDGLPVIARADTFSYRFEKFVSRNRVSVIAGILVFLSLIGGIAATSWQAVRAEQQKKLAEKRFEQVRELANNVIFKYHDKIKDLPGATEARALLVEDATKYLDSIAAESAGSDELSFELAQAYQKIGDVQGEAFYANLGDSTGATESYRKCAKLLETLTAGQPENTKFQTELRRSYSALVLVLLRQQIWDEAFEISRKNVSLSEELLRRDEQNPEFILNVLRSKVVFGDAQKFVEGYTKQTETYRNTLAFFDRLPTDVQRNEKLILGQTAVLQRLGTSLEEWGETLKDQNFPPVESEAKFLEAAGLHRKSLENMQYLNREFPQNQRYFRNLAGATMNVGSALARANRGAESLPFLEDGLASMKKMADADVQNNEAQRDVAEGLQYLAMGLEKSGRDQNALENYRAALDILEKINAQDTANFEFLEQQQNIYLSIGDIYRKQRNIPQAFDAYQKSLQSTQKMNKQTSGNKIDIFEVNALISLAELYQFDDKEKTRSYFTQALEKLQSLKSQNKLSKDNEYKLDLVNKKSI